MSAPLVSVVVPTHNRAHLLPRLLGSVLGQDIGDFEVLVVNDGSSDDTAEVLAGWPDDRLRPLHHERARGVAEARNTGTRAARARWVAWCDDDDVWAPAKLRLQLEALRDYPAARWCNGGSVYVDNALHPSRTRRCPAPGNALPGLLRINTVTGGGSGVLADRELALSVGGFDGRFSMFADWHMWARLAAAAPLAVVDYPLVGYVEHQEAMSRHRLHLALDELTPFADALADLAEAAGLDTRLDRIALGHWMLRQQTGVGRRRAGLLLPFRLVRRQLMVPWRVLPYSAVVLAAPSLLQRRWAGRWVVDERSWRYAQSWLAELRRSLPAVEQAGPQPSAGR